MAEALEFFRLTPELVEIIHRYQKGKCAICGHPLKKRNIDHDHKTGEVRGILCWRCNKALGYFSDLIERLVAALEYLRNPPARAALGAPHFGNVGRTTNKKKPSRGHPKKVAAKHPVMLCNGPGAQGE